MRSKRTATIRIETYEVTTVRRRPSTVRAWCSACEAEVEMFSLLRAAEWAAVPPEKIPGWIEAGDLHMAEINPGWPFVCKNSLQQQMKKYSAVERLKIQSPESPKSTAKRE